MRTVRGGRSGTVGALVKESASEASDPGGFLLIKALAMPLIDPPLEIHWLPDLRFLIQGFLRQSPRQEDVQSIRAPRPGPEGLPRHGS